MQEEQGRKPRPVGNRVREGHGQQAERHASLGQSKMKGRRRPSRPKERRSTTKPITGLPAQGSEATNMRSPSPAGERPSEVRRRAMATVKKPQGTPWAK